MRVTAALIVSVLGLLPHAAQAQWRTSILPVIGSAPETGGQFGVAVFRTRQHRDSAATRPSSLVGNAVITSKGQQRAFVEYDRWSAGNDRRLLVTAIGSRFPLPFHGLGDETGEASTPYEPVTLELGVTGQRRIAQATWQTMGLRVVNVEVDPSASGVGAPAAIYPYRLLTASLGVAHDTRDGVFAPTKGKMIDASVGYSPYWSDDGNRAIGRLRIDARGYRSVGEGVIAAQAVLQGNEGDAPIDQLALVGHNALNRGYTMGRFRDNWMAATQVEWRSGTFGWRDRLGVAAFAGAAVIAGEIGELGRGRILPSAGGGFRFRLDPRTRSTIRIDFGVGASGQSGLYVAFNEAF